MAREFEEGQISRHGMVSVEFTNVGPRLFVGSTLVRSWLGTDHNAEADELADQIDDEIRSAAIPD